MNYQELQQKELLINYIINKISKKSNSQINFELIFKYNNSLITGTSLKNFNQSEFTTEYITSTFGEYIYTKDYIDYSDVYDKIKEFHIAYLSKSLNTNKSCFKEKLLSLTDEFNVNFEVKSKEQNLYNIKFLESKLTLDFIKICEQDNFEIISIQLID